MRVQKYTKNPLWQNVMTIELSTFFCSNAQPPDAKRFTHPPLVKTFLF
jgi:hypothetical protein